MRRWRSLLGALIGPLRRPPAPSDARATISYAYPAARRPDGTIDTNLAAQQAGVSQRTMQRWIAQGIPTSPRSSAAAATRERVNQRNQLEIAQAIDRRRTRFVTEGSGLVVSGQVRVSSDSRQRTLGSDTARIGLSGEQMDALYEALGAAVDGQAALDMLGQVVSDSYGVPGMTFEGLDWLDLDR